MSSKQQQKYETKKYNKTEEYNDSNINSLTPDDLLVAMGRNYNLFKENCQQAAQRAWDLWTKPGLERAAITNDDKECPDWQYGN